MILLCTVPFLITLLRKLQAQHYSTIQEKLSNFQSKLKIGLV